MDNDQIVKVLNELLHVDIDAIRAYGQALDAAKDPEVVNRLTEFRGDHERHVNELSSIVRRFGGTPVGGPDIKGFLLEGMTAIRAMMGEDGALKAMRQNEQVTNRAYERALQQPFPADVLDVVRRNREDERRHLAWIEARVKAHVSA